MPSWRSMDGRFEDALDIVEKMLARGEQEGVIGIAQLYANHPYYRTCVYRGEHLEEIERQQGRGVGGGSGTPMGFAVLGWIQSYMGKKAEVSEILDKYVVNRPGFGTDEGRDTRLGGSLVPGISSRRRPPPGCRNDA